MKVENISDMDTLIKKLNSFSNSFIYRGHADADWNLQTTLERVCGVKFSRDFAEKCENHALEQFQSRFHLYDQENIQPNCLLEWLSIMQHYGVPTRLLDFTTSPFVALYFALEAYDMTKRPDLSVVAINYSQVMDISLRLISEQDNSFSENRDSIYGKQNEVFVETVDRFNRKILWITEPQRLNARIDRQAGCFLIAGDKGISIESLINATDYETVEAVTMIISSSLVESIFALLRKVNISGKSIYGDLNGLAKSIMLEIKVYAA
jgi:hypothetical protein